MQSGIRKAGWEGWGERKGKERKSIYIAPFRTKVLTKRSGMDHTVLPANNTMPGEGWSVDRERVPLSSRYKSWEGEAPWPEKNEFSAWNGM